MYTCESSSAGFGALLWALGASVVVAGCIRDKFGFRFRLPMPSDALPMLGIWQNLYVRNKGYFYFQTPGGKPPQIHDYFVTWLTNSRARLEYRD